MEEGIIFKLGESLARPTTWEHENFMSGSHDESFADKKLGPTAFFFGPSEI